MGSREVITGSPAGFALENIITNQLPDGSLCWVTNATAFFVFRRAATAPPFVPDGTNIVAPIGGPGLWFRLDTISGGVSDGASAFFATINSPVTIVGGLATYPAFTAFSNAVFAAGTSNLNFTHANGILTYTGAAAKRFAIHGEISGALPPTFDNVGALTILRNGLVQAGGLDTGVGILTAEAPNQLSVDAFYLLNPGDTIQLGIAYGIAAVQDFAVYAASIVVH